jgi:hypothetical protein
MVATCICVKARCSLIVFGLARDAETNKGLKRPIDGGSGHSGSQGFDVLENLVRCGMIVTVNQRFKDDPPLYR